jgi:4-hydroxy-3-methylbut-2-enyl diphosphate reductase
MEIIKAKDIGFCFGVKRAIKKAEEALKDLPANDIYMLGEIIHNPQVIRKFKKKDINFVKEITEVPSHKYLISRAHGISLSEEKYAQSHDITLIDTTCPYVKRLQKIVTILKREGYQIIVFGDRSHPEIRSLLSYIDGQALVIQSIDGLIEIKQDKIRKKSGLLSQTTKDIEHFRNIVKAMIDYTEELRVFNTVCKATVLRQQATRELAKKVDLMIVIGGKNSANTGKLANLSKRAGIETYHIEDEKQLNKNWFKNKRFTGITSGASTPEWVTNKIITKIKDLIQNR